jgi:Transposase DDE domain group 1
LLQADSGFAREALMAWCEMNRVDYLFGLARDARLVAMIESELAAAKSAAEASGKPALRFKEFPWATLKSWSRERRVNRQGGVDAGRSQPALRRHLAKARGGRRAAPLREALLRARRHGEPHQGMPA